jgi:hypothetical protein
MVDIVNPEVVDTQSGVGYSVQGASIDKLELMTASGQNIELKQMMIELSYYEDIYAFAISGSLVLRDGQGLADKFGLTGNEFLTVSFGRVKGSKANITKKFRVYKLGNRDPAGNLNSELLTLHFCSEELLLSEQIRVSKSYSGQEIHKTVRAILTDELKTKKDLFIEETKGIYNFTVPRFKPFEALSWLSTYARPATQDLAGADMICFENKFGYNFVSLRSMFAQDPYKTFKYQQNNVESSMEDKTSSVLQYEVVKSYDMLNEISSGTFANRLISVDPLTRSYKVTDFSYDDYIKNNKPMNGNGVLPETVNRLGKSPSTSPESVVKVVIGNSSQYEVGYIKDKPGAVANDIYIENYVPNRTAQIALANYTIVKIAVPGDPALTAGMTINFNTYTFGMNDGIRELDKHYSGKYLINAVRHILQSQGVYQTVMEISKESYDTQLQAVKATDE